jgi:integrase
MPSALITSDTVIRNVKPGDPRRRLSDGDGLYLLLFVKGGSHGWRLDYSHAGRRKTLSLGTYPETGLKLAREKARAARELIAAGRDPSEARKEARAQQLAVLAARERADAGLPAVGSFEEVAREWFAARRDGWAKSYADKVMARLEADVFPWIGAAPVGEIQPPALLETMRRIESRGVVETAHRALESCGQVFRYAIATGRAVSNPARDLKDALQKPVVRHMPALTEPSDVGALLRAIHGYSGTLIVCSALKLAPLLMVRPGELRQAVWSEFDLDAALWTIPAARMKRQLSGKLNGPPHLVPLPTQAVAILRDLAALTDRGPESFVFRGERMHDRPMSDNTLNAALRAMGYPRETVSAHGFRATARTLIAERLGIAPEVIEAQLAHTVSDSLGRAYNRTQYLDQRKAMMQAWADYLDTLRAGNVVHAEFGGRAA